MISVHSFESMGTLDGPGLRLVVFLQGCNFRCLYCANPDTIDCAGGKQMKPEEIVQMAMREKPFFGKKGGVTFSGGEPLLQAEALLPLVKDLHSKSIHVCLDTNGSIDTAAARELLSEADLVLLDIKQISDEKHRSLTAHSNAKTLATAAFLQEIGKPFWLRMVIVPGYSDADEDLQATGRLLGNYDCIERVDLLPYHTLGKHKYEALGWSYKLEGVPLPSKEQMEHARDVLADYFKGKLITTG